MPPRATKIHDSPLAGLFSFVAWIRCVSTNVIVLCSNATQYDYCRYDLQRMPTPIDHEFLQFSRPYILLF